MTHPVLSLIESITARRGQLQGDPRTLARLQVLQRWQVQRLASTYGDYAVQPRYRDAIEFFTNDLYGPHDPAQRYRDLTRVLDPWQRVLPEHALGAVTAALQLEALSLQLDLTMLHALGEHELNTATYGQAYRIADQRAERQHQISLTIECGQALDALVSRPWVGKALQLAGVPARLSGVLALHEFLERGYVAFAKMNGAAEFLRVIEQRETAIMDNLFAARPDPFIANVIRNDIATSNQSSH